MKKTRALLCLVAIACLSITSLDAGTGRCIKTGIKDGHCWTIEYTVGGVTWDELSCGDYNDEFQANCVKDNNPQ